MADSDGQGVGGIGARRARQTEQSLDHVLHLAFFGLAIAYDGLFDLAWTVIEYRQAVLHGSDHRRPPGMPEFQGGTGVRRQEDILHGSHGRQMELDHLVDSLKDFVETMGKRRFLTGLDRTAGDKAQPPAINLNHSVAGDP